MAMRRIRPDKAIAQQTDQETTTRSPSGRGKRWRKYLLGSLLALVVTILCAPLLLQSKMVVLGIVQRTEAVSPLQLDMQSISFGWFRPLRLTGVEIKDSEGKLLGKIERLDTELSLWRLLTQRSDLGTISIDHLDATIEIAAGSTNVEQVLEELIAKYATTEPQDPTAPGVAVKLVIRESVVHAIDSLSQETWDLELRQAVVEMDGQPQGLPKVAAAGKLLQRHPATGIAGQFVIKLHEDQNASVNDGDVNSVDSDSGVAAIQSIENASANSGTIHTSAEFQTLPLMWISLLKRRLPELPIESGAGWVSLKAQGTIQDAEHWKFDVTDGLISQVVIKAPALIGPQPASIQQANWSGSWQLDGKRFHIVDNQLNCDFGEASGNASLPWPLTPPVVTAPWIVGGEFNLRTKVDLPKLLEVAPSLVPIRDNMVLLSGAADLQMQQKLDGRGLPQSRYVLTLGDLEANIQGQMIRWDDPLAATMQVQPDAAGDVRFQGDVKAEFCDFQASGSLDGGRISGNVNLQKLKKRLDEFVTLPVERVDGTADGTVSWERGSDGLITVNGDVQTTPLLLKATGGELTEPAWRGSGNLTLRLVENQLQRLDRAVIRLQSSTEEATVELFEPVSLANIQDPGATPTAKLPPAAARIKFKGDLASWQRRLLLWQSWQPDIAFRGKLDLEASALVDATHVELTKATWMAEPLEIQTSQWNIAEPRMKGEFQGRIDSQNVTRLEIASLEVQAASFALRAADNVIPDDANGGRQGAGAFRINLANLTSSMNTPVASANNPAEASRPAMLTSAGGPPASMSPNTAQPWPLRLSGEIVGNANWTVTKAGITWKVTADGTNVLAESVSPKTTVNAPGALASTANSGNRRGDVAVQKIWEEARLRVGCEGNWNAETGAVNLNPTELASDWIAYAGQVVMDPKDVDKLLTVDGRYTYDAAKVTERLEPWIHNWVSLEGQRTEPVKLVMFNSQPGSPPLSALNAETQLGWERARAIGLNIGPAEVPVKVSSGIFQTASSIPVNKGKVEFDLTADLTASPLVIRQKPGNILTNVDITPEMYQGWLQYVTPILAQATSAEGELSLVVDRAELVPADLRQQNVAGRVVIHRAAIGPGPLSTSILQLVQYINAIRNGDMAAATSAIPLAGNVLNTLSPGSLPGAAPLANQPAVAPQLGNQWLQLKEQNIEFLVQDGKVIHREFVMQVGDVQVKSSGAVAMDGTMEMLVSVPVQEEWIKKQAFLQPLSGKSIDIPVRGNLNQPQVDWRSIATLTTNLAAGTAVQAGQNAIQRELNKQLQKLPLDKLDKPFETLDKFFSPMRQP
jgi:translocation and assembly module TamB